MYNWPFIAVCAAAAMLAACGKKERQASAGFGERADWAEISAELRNPKGVAVGAVSFRSVAAGVLMRIEMKGLSPGWHGIHFHQTADCSDGADGFKKSGGHFDPDNHEHGLFQLEGAERGDLPNIHADADGVVRAEILRGRVSLSASEENAAAVGPFPLLDDDGFAVVVHAAADDQLTQPIGGSGDRVACAAVKAS